MSSYKGVKYLIRLPVFIVFMLESLWGWLVGSIISMVGGKTYSLLNTSQFFEDHRYLISLIFCIEIACFIFCFYGILISQLNKIIKTIVLVIITFTIVFLIFLIFVNYVGTHLSFP